MAGRQPLPAGGRVLLRCPLSRRGCTSEVPSAVACAPQPVWLLSEQHSVSTSSLSTVLRVLPESALWEAVG